MCENEEERERLLLVLDENITNQITKVKNKQHFDRKHPVNKSKMSYQNTY